MSKVISKDGTPIGFDRLGAGPSLIVVDGALCSRSFGPSPKLAAELSSHFTVYTYDRRGRGASGDTQPYARERELDDIAALIAEAGGAAFLVGLSSGAALALEAAASGLNVIEVAAYEPPYMVDNAPEHARADHGARLRERLAADRRGDAVKYFMRDMVGAPAFVVAMMRFMPGVWTKLKAVAHTLPYDAAVMGDWSVPTRFASIRMPTLVMDGEKTDVRLQRAVEVVARIIPGAVRRTLSGQTHAVSPKVLAPVLVDFFKSERLACAA